jgi:hypothetical protein
MRFFKSAFMAASALTLAAMSACGGGSGGDPDTSIRFGQSVTAPANTLAVTAGTSTIPKASYALDTGYTNASGVVNINGHVIEWVWPESAAFDSGIFFAQDDVRKFVVGLSEAFPGEHAYRCVSVAWTEQELADLAVAFDEPDLPSLQKCPSGITIDAAGHHVSFNDWTLVSDDATKSVKFSLNVSWLLQNGSLSPGGGSGSVSIGPGSGSGSISIGGSGSGVGLAGTEAVSAPGGSISLSPGTSITVAH